MTVDRKVEHLEREVKRLQAALAESQRETRAARKHVRDSYMGAVLSGLAVRWNWGETPSQRLAEHAERLVEAVMRQRSLWERGQSANQLPRSYDAVPLPEATKPDSGQQPQPKRTA